MSGKLRLNLRINCKFQEDYMKCSTSVTQSHTSGYNGHNDITALFALSVTTVPVASYEVTDVWTSVS